jgi:hypothetical protein
MSRGAGVRLLVLTSFVLAMASGCASPEEKARKAAETLRSWKATLQLLDREAGRGAVPSVYADELRSAAEQEIGGGQ